MHYREQAGGKQRLYARRGTALRIEKVRFHRKSIAIEVKSAGQPRTSSLTFRFDHDLDDAFTARPEFDAMLRGAFRREGSPAPPPRIQLFTDFTEPAAAAP